MEASDHFPASFEDDLEDDASLAQFLEEEVLGSRYEDDGDEDYDESIWTERPAKKVCLDKLQDDTYSNDISECLVSRDLSIKSGNFSKIPQELFQNILKFLSSEDLVKCALVCHFLRVASSDESLWRRLYCLRWGLPSISDNKKKPRGSAWKHLYFERDKSDMIDFVRNTPQEFREYYIQMQAAKRSQAPLASQVKDDFLIVDTTVAEQITSWRRSHGLPDVCAGDHVCSGQTCSYHQMGDIFLCEKTGRAHVCDDTCRETIPDPSNELLVCTISGRCFDRWITPAEEAADESARQMMENTTAAEEVEEPFMGSGRFARAYSLGYNCDDERELKAALREVIYPGSNREKCRFRNSCCQRY